jgi:hypothetical protein
MYKISELFMATVVAVTSEVGMHAMLVSFGGDEFKSLKVGSTLLEFCLCISL